jgi:hypothetical protein
MKCKVLCYVAGKTFDVIVGASNYQEAKIVAKAQHPNSKIIGVTGVFDFHQKP